MEQLSGEAKVMMEENRQGEAMIKPGVGSKKLYLESYGCQMNFSDSEIVVSILDKEGYETTSDPKQADLILLNTCSIRDKAEQTVRNRLKHFKRMKRENKNMKIGIYKIFYFFC